MKEKNFYEPNFIGIVISQITNKPEWDNAIDIRFVYDSYDDNMTRASGRGADSDMLNRYISKLFNFRECNRVYNSVSCDDIETLSEAFRELNHSVDRDLGKSEGDRDYINLTMPCDLSNVKIKIKELFKTYEAIKAKKNIEIP